MNIRSKILFYSLLLTSFAAIVVVADSFYNVDTVIVSNAETKLEAIANIQKNRVLATINNYKTQVSQVAGRTSLTDDVANYNLNHDPKTVQSLKARALDVKTSVPEYKDVYILDDTGKVIVSSDENDLEEHLTIIDYDLLKTDKKVFVANEKGLSKNLIITGPVMQSGKFVGLIVIVTGADDITNIVSDYTGLGETGETTIAYRDQNGDAVYIQPPRFSKTNEPIVISKDKTNAAITQALLKNESLTKENVDYANNKVYAYTKYIDETGWGLVVKINKSELYTPIFSHALQLGIITLLVIIFTIFASLKIATTISSPIEDLKKAATKIEDGDYNTKLEVASKDELGKLAEAFNSMGAAIVASRADVDKQVKEQTSEIVEKEVAMRDQQRAILNILEDIEEEKIKLEQEKVKDEALLSSLGEGLIVTDKDGKIIKMNKSAEEMLGWKFDEVANKSMIDTIPIVDENNKTIPESERPIHLALSKKERIMSFTYGKTYFYVKKDKTSFPVAVGVTPVLYEGEVIGAMDVFRDISKEFAIDRAKTEFVSLASHQLRTPLSAINWYAEMLINGDAGKLTKDQKQYLDEIYKGNQRMVDLVNSLLNVSRIELGTFAVDPEPTDFVAVAKDVIKEQVEKITKKKLKINEKYASNLPKIEADPKLTRIIFQNLVSNAVKYTPDKGNITIDISKDSSNMIIKVADTGYGIPEEQKDKIFTKLFRADNVREKETDGTGLGLYIVKSIIDHAKGSIKFDSIENKGTTFTITVPLSGMEKKEGSKPLT